MRLDDLLEFVRNYPMNAKWGRPDEVYTRVWYSSFTATEPSNHGVLSYSAHYNESNNKAHVDIMLHLYNIVDNNGRPVKRKDYVAAIFDATEEGIRKKWPDVKEVYIEISDNFRHFRNY